VAMGKIEDDEFFTDLGYADDLVFVSLTTEKARTMMLSFQHVAEQCGLFLNPKKDKSEVYSLEPGAVVVEKGGATLETVTKYKYLGAFPMDPTASIMQRKGLAWAVIHKFDQLWLSKIVTNATKVRFFNVFVKPTFFYGSESWPCSAPWNDTLNSYYSSMVRYCLNHNSDSRLITHGCGCIPLGSSVALAYRLRLGGHCLRHEGMLPELLHCSGPLEFRRPRNTTLEKQLRDTIPYDLDDWQEKAEHRVTWERMVQQVVGKHENEQWNTYYKTCHNRWAYRSAAIETTYQVAQWHHQYFHSGTRPTKESLLTFKPFAFPLRTNTWHAQEPKHPPPVNQSNSSNRILHIKKNHDRRHTQPFHDTSVNRLDELDRRYTSNPRSLTDEEIADVLFRRMYNAWY